MAAPSWKIRKMLTAAYQHSGSQVKLVKELGDEDVDFDQALLVSFFHLTDDVSEPLVLLLGTGHPNEEHLDRERG